MKSLCVLFVAFFSINSFSQEPEAPTIFSTFNLGVLGGINFSNYNNAGPSLIIEGTTNIISNFNLKLSLGYSRSYQLYSYHVNTYSITNIEGIETYQADSYDVNKKGYDIIPFSIGVQYIFNLSFFSPYALFELAYNSVGTKIYKSNISTRSYYSFDELPDDYKTKNTETFVDRSYKIGIGIGTSYKLNSAINLDVRYLYQFDHDLFNTHQLLVGLIF